MRRIAHVAAPPLAAALRAWQAQAAERRWLHAAGRRIKARAATASLRTALTVGAQATTNQAQLLIANATYLCAAKRALCVRALPSLRCHIHTAA